MRKIVFLMALLSSLAFANYGLERQCNNGNAWSCVDLGYLYNFGEGVKQDYKKASELFGKSCEMGYAVGCYNLGIYYYNRRDYNTAMEFYGKACDLGEQKGCDAYKKIKLNKN